jgi:hypothetical protein
MDGLLVDSEPYWKIAEKICFGKLGLTLTDELLRQVMGFRLNEVVEHWYNYQPWGEKNFETVEADVLETVFTNKQDSIRPSTITMLHTINFGSTHKQTKNSLESLQFSIKSLVRAEIAISTLDHIFTYMLVKHIKSMENYNITQERINQFTEESESIFNAFIDFKFNHLIDIKINLF